MTETKENDTIYEYVNDEIILHNLSMPYLTKHLITYLGNKRKLLPFINETLIYVKQKLNKDLVSTFDGFSGSGCVSRLLKFHSTNLYSNDLEKYCEVINNTYLQNPNKKDIQKIKKIIKDMNNIEEKDYIKGNISKFYSPKDDKDIKEDERVFYTNQNSQIIDTIRSKINKLEKKYQNYILSQLLIKSSIHVNTSGIFRGFHKKNNIGHFGGEKETDLKRITKKIVLDEPIFSNQNHKCNIKVFKKDVNKLICNKEELPEVDITYYDPPYNQHPYASNYFMLNVIAEDKEITDDTKKSKVSGIIEGWNKSEYNYKKSAKKSFQELIKNTRSKFIIISYNNEGIINEKEFIEILSKYKYEKREKEYISYRGSRNFSDRNKTVKEILWIVDKR
jgi:adenine-specific DNA-methyltransferase